MKTLTRNDEAGRTEFHGRDLEDGFGFGGHLAAGTKDGAGDVAEDEDDDGLVFVGRVRGLASEAGDVFGLDGEVLVDAAADVYGEVEEAEWARRRCVLE